MEMTTMIVEEHAHRSRLEGVLNQDPWIARSPLRQPVEEETYETLVEDCRESLRPAQHVEQKLVAMLEASPMLVSQLQKDSRPHPR